MIDHGDAAPPATVAPDLSGWEDPPRRPSASFVPVLSVEGFEGPLDWLLEMVRARKIDLARLSILALIEAFADALEDAAAQHDARSVASLWRWGDWLVMAADLTLLRSRLLLPVHSCEGSKAHAEAETLRRRLADRAHIAAVADWLEQRPQLGREVFMRGQPEVRTARRVGDLTDLLRACLVVLQLPDDVTVYRPRPPVLWRVTDAVVRIREMMAVETGSWVLGDFLPNIDADKPDRDRRCRAAVASTLMAGLEMAREGALILEQEEGWTTIYIKPRSHPDSEATGHADSPAIPEAPL
jgi:segregation and condensation protein A